MNLLSKVINWGLVSSLIVVSAMISMKSYESNNQIIVDPNMPLIASYNEVQSAPPNPKRGEEWAYYLQSSVRIRNGNIGGSGTICYYDKATNWAYIISCGHLFDGNMRPGQNGTKQVKIEMFYKNNELLSAPKAYTADVICYDNDEDISFLKFRPDWEIEHWFPIASKNYLIEIGQKYESTGCDHLTDAAAYSVEIIDNGTQERSLQTKFNSPRPGRSGGALLSNDGYYIAIVWGTSNYDGTGIGFYVPLRRIHAYALQFPDVAWLLNVNKPIQFIESTSLIEDGVKKIAPRGFIPIPKK